MMSSVESREDDMGTKTKVVDLRMRERKAVMGWLLLLLSTAVLLTTGCNTSALGAQEATEAPPQPFSARRAYENGAIVEWSGYVEGYEPGAEASFDVSIKNETGEDWPGRFCLQLMDAERPAVLATLEQRPFNLQPGLGFSDSITVTVPESLDEGAYGLSLVVRAPHGPTVDMVPITVGETDEERGTATQRDMDAAIEACPAVSGARGEAQNLITLAREDLAERVDAGLDEIVVQDVKEAEFPDASLGVPEPDKAYAQVITPGFVIRLEAGGKTYEYHAAGERVVLAVGPLDDSDS